MNPINETEKLGFSVVFDDQTNWRHSRIFYERKTIRVCTYGYKKEVTESLVNAVIAHEIGHLGTKNKLTLSTQDIDSFFAEDIVKSEVNAWKIALTELLPQIPYLKQLWLEFAQDMINNYLYVDDNSEKYERSYTEG